MFNSFYQLHAFFSGKAKQKTKKLGFVLLLSSPRAQTLLYLPNFPENQSYFKKTAITHTHTHTHTHTWSQRQHKFYFFSMFEGAKTKIKTRSRGIYFDVI